MDRSEVIAGFYAPVHRTLTEPILLGGVPRVAAIVNGTLAAAVGLGLRVWIAGAGVRLVGVRPSALPAAPRRMRPGSMMNLAEYRPTGPRAS